MEFHKFCDPVHEILVETRISYSFASMKCPYLVVLFFMLFAPTVAYDPLDPTGNITIRWDIMAWTLDGYLATVTINNFQTYRQITSPGWTLGWSWAKKEVIWNMVGAQASEQGDCSKFKANIPHCCKRNPTVVDMLPSAPYNQQYSNCCKSGVLAAWEQNPTASISAFQMGVGVAGTSNKTVKLPKNFTLLGPGPGYTCGPAKKVPSSAFPTADLRRRTQALMTWNVTCTYSQLRASKNPKCCVSLSSFYNDTITPCPTCSCGCHNKNNCVSLMNASKQVNPIVLNTTKKDNAPVLLQCTRHMCPIRVHWHVKVNYRDYWRVKLAVTNFNYRMNYTDWTLVVQHPNLSNITTVYSFQYKPIGPYESINDTAMFFGLKFYNDLLMEAGPQGNIQSEVLLHKSKEKFTLKQGWAFPRKVYFNGDECELPPPEAYPYLPNYAPLDRISFSTMAPVLLMILIISHNSYI